MKKLTILTAFAIVVFAMAMLVVLPMTASASENGSSAEGPVLDRHDLTGDGYDDIVRGYPHGQPADEGNVPGEVHIISGKTGETLRIIQGTEAGDEFGSAIAYGDDLNGNGYLELIIGAPIANAVHVVSTRFLDHEVIPPPGGPGDPCPPDDVVIDVVDIAVVQFETMSSEVFDAGYDVAAFYDFREDGYPTFRFTARYINDDNEVATREYIVHGYTGLLLARVERYIQDEGIARPRGDASRDGHIHEEDMNITIYNLGLEGEDLSEDDGDFTGDQQVGADDLMIVMEEQGNRLYDPTSDTPPDDFVVQDEGCDSYYARDGEQWYHIELFSIGCFGPIGASGAAGDYACDIPDMISKCDDLADNVNEALELVDMTCGGHPDDIEELRVLCVTCDPDIPEDFDGHKPSGPASIQPKPPGNMDIVICIDRFTDPHSWSQDEQNCSSLAHELTHAYQYCLYGLLTDYCSFKFMHRDNCNRFCREWEAMIIDGKCDHQHPGDPKGCCQYVCEHYHEVGPFECEDECKEWCDGLDYDDFDEEFCCEGGVFTCDTTTECDTWYCDSDWYKQVCDPDGVDCDE